MTRVSILGQKCVELNITVFFNSVCGFKFFNADLDNIERGMEKGKKNFYGIPCSF